MTSRKILFRYASKNDEGGHRVTGKQEDLSQTSWPPKHQEHPEELTQLFNVWHSRSTLLGIDFQSFLAPSVPEKNSCAASVDGLLWTAFCLAQARWCRSSLDKAASRPNTAILAMATPSRYNHRAWLYVVSFLLPRSLLVNAPSYVQCAKLKLMCRCRHCGAAVCIA